ncbi:unnamed protein product [Cylindrotheca closterium]|uniref:Uncharacterized protein n=1 Tax=Cylindrotheca closterium TaxID=2856 RepID=A0AAD2JHI7_9STRA|nr:unnamed protein product [Cylindrotheca closterium]
MLLNLTPTGICAWKEKTWKKCKPFYVFAITGSTNRSRHLAEHWGALEVDMICKSCKFSHMKLNLMRDKDIKEGVSMILGAVGWGRIVEPRVLTWNSQSQYAEEPGYTFSARTKTSRPAEGFYNCGPIALDFMFENLGVYAANGIDGVSNVREKVLRGIISLLQEPVEAGKIVTTHENWELQRRLMGSVFRANSGLYNFARDPSCIVCHNTTTCHGCVVALPRCGKRIHADCQISNMATRESSNGPRNSHGLAAKCMYCSVTLDGFFGISYRPDEDVVLGQVSYYPFSGSPYETNANACLVLGSGAERERIAAERRDQLESAALGCGEGTLRAPRPDAPSVNREVDIKNAVDALTSVAEEVEMGVSAAEEEVRKAEHRRDEATQRRNAVSDSIQRAVAATSPLVQNQSPWIQRRGLLRRSSNPRPSARRHLLAQLLE